MLKTQMQDTSLQAFYGLHHQLNRREHQLLEVLKMIQPASDRDLAYKLDWEPNMVTGRRNSLVAKGVVEESHKARSPVTRKLVIYWQVRQPSKKSMTTDEANNFLKSLAGQEKLL